MKTEYALRALYELAQSPQFLSRRDIAQRQGIPISFLEQILIQLKNAGIIASRPGPGGGFGLARKKEAITLWDIYVAVENPFPYEGQPCFPSLKAPCERLPICKLKQVWFAVNENIRKTMASLSLDKMVGNLS